jgi:hypothetical protein
MKSAYEKAMERLGTSAEPARTLTPEQKSRIAEVNNLYQSKIAERETFLRSRITAARAEGNATEIAELETQLHRDLAGLREEWESKKKKVWEE